MLNAATRTLGESTASPDTCNTPNGSGVDVPTPYVNTASNTQAVNFSMKVKIEGGQALSQKSSVPTTTGDEAGTSHPVIKGEARYTTGNFKVYVEQSPAVTFASLTTGNAMNASSGSTTRDGPRWKVYPHAARAASSAVSQVLMSPWAASRTRMEAGWKEWG